MISPRGDGPLYQQVAADVRQQIKTGQLREGQQLPSEPDLAHQYGVGKDTVRDALAMLRNEGLIVTRRGYRAVVTTPAAQEPVEASSGSQVVIRMPSHDERQQHDIPVGVPVFIVIDQHTGAGDLYPADRYRLVIP